MALKFLCANAFNLEAFIKENNVTRILTIFAGVACGLQLGCITNEACVIFS